MLYKPKFCSNCGEKIERIDWNLLTSRRFCDVCSIENRRYDVAPRLAVGAGLLALMFGFGSFWQGASEVQPPSAAIPAKLKNEAVSGERREAPPAERQPSSAQVPGQIPSISPPEPAEITTLKPKSSEAKFYCGTLTKKGTPCSRKVKARGTRCFQHEGRPAAPPIN